MKINDKMFHLPPYISTTWENVKALYMKGSLLIVNLIDGETVSIPGLAPETIETIFAAHASAKEVQPKQDSVHFGFSGIADLGNAMQHNPAQANIPDLPPEVLEKVATIASIVAPEDLAAVPKPEPHCNCLHCQIARTILQQARPHEEIEEVTAEELSFKEWEIEEIGNKLYCVTSATTPTEKYNVYLGDPIGCTCGHEGCQHIVAVLQS